MITCKSLKSLNRYCRREVGGIKVCSRMVRLTQSTLTDRSFRVSSYLLQVVLIKVKNTPQNPNIYAACRLITPPPGWAMTWYRPLEKYPAGAWAGAGRAALAAKPADASRGQASCNLFLDRGEGLAQRRRTAAAPFTFLFVHPAGRTARAGGAEPSRASAASAPAGVMCPNVPGRGSDIASLYFLMLFLAFIKTAFPPGLSFNAGFQLQQGD